MIRNRRRSRPSCGATATGYPAGAFGLATCSSAPATWSSAPLMSARTGPIGSVCFSIARTPNVIRPSVEEIFRRVAATAIKYAAGLRRSEQVGRGRVLRHALAHRPDGRHALVDREHGPSQPLQQEPDDERDDEPEPECRPPGDDDAVGEREEHQAAPSFFR